MKNVLILAWAILASATTYTLSIYAPGTVIDGAQLDAAGASFFTGISGPATYCPANVNTCPPVKGTLTIAGLSAMAVKVPGGQQIYVAPTGAVKYTQAHSSYMPPKSYVGGWYNKTVVSNCEPTIEVLDFLATDGSNIGGVLLCPNIPNYMDGTGASYQLYTNTPGFNQSNCVNAVGILQNGNAATYGCWQYI